MSSKKQITQSALSELNKIRAYDKNLAKQLTKMIKSSDRQVRMDIYEPIQREFNIDPHDDIDNVFQHIANTLASKYSSGKFGSARNASSGFDSRGRSFSLDGLPMLDADSDKAIFKGSLADISGSRRANEYSRDSVHDAGTVNVRSGPMTISNRPLVNQSPVAGPYFCPETPDRVKVDGMYVVSKPDDVRNFYDNGDVMVLRLLGGSADEDNKPGTARCEAVGVFRKAIQRYEDMYRNGASRGSNLVNWTFYYDNGGKTDEEMRPDDNKWNDSALGSLTTPAKRATSPATGATSPVTGTPDGKLTIVLSRFDGREDFGYVFNHTFDLNGAGNDKFSETNVLRFFKRESPFNVFMDKIIGDDDAIRFVECDPCTPFGDDNNMKQAACERVQRYLKSDQTAVIVVPVKFLEEHGFDEKILNLTNIVKNLRRNNRSFYDRIAYYFAKSATMIKFQYSIKTVPDFSDLTNVYTGFESPDLSTDAVNEYQTGDLGNRVDNYNVCYNGGTLRGPATTTVTGSAATPTRGTTATPVANPLSTTALFQIIRGSKATDIKEIYIVKEAPELNQNFPYTGNNEMTLRLMRENVVNAARIPYVTENLLSDFISRRELFPLMTSESAARKYHVRPLEPANPFKDNTNKLALFDYEQLPEDILADCKSGVGVIVYPECDGTEGSCVPPQLSAMAERLDLRLVSAPIKYFTMRDKGVKLVGLRCVKKATHNNHELYITNGSKGVQLQSDGDSNKTLTGADVNNCKIASTDVDIKAFMTFFNNEKIDKSKYVASCESSPTPAKDINGCIVPLK